MNKFKPESNLGFQKVPIQKNILNTTTTWFSYIFGHKLRQMVVEMYQNILMGDRNSVKSLSLLTFMRLFPPSRPRGYR